MRRSPASRNTLQPPRSGAALLEVLIAILAMGIGVVSLMSLFPLSVVRTAQAHQLTVGTGVRLNAEAYLENYPTFWIDPDHDNDKLEHNVEPYLVDPLGNIRIGTPNVGTITRYNAGFTNINNAKNVMTYDGNWLSQAEQVGVTSTATSVTFGPNINLTAVPNVAGPIFSRVILFDTTGKFSATRIITSIASPASAPTVNWTDNVNFTIARARVETQDEQFSWAISVHRNDSLTEFVGDIFMPIFFRREYSTTSETPLNNGGASVFTAGSVNAIFTHTGTRPAIRKGGYVFDSENCYWYRVNDYSEAGNTITMNLEFPAQANSNEAVFFKGLVDVYYLGTKQVTK